MFLKHLWNENLHLHSLYFPQNTFMSTECRLHSLYFPQNTFMSTECRLHSLYFPQNTFMLTGCRLHSLYVSVARISVICILFLVALVLSDDTDDRNKASQRYQPIKQESAASFTNFYL